MAEHIVRCGNSNNVYNASTAAKEEAAPWRVTTRMHILDRAPVAAGFRVIARLQNGATAFLIAAGTRAEAVELARKRVTDVPADAVRLMLERWKGGERSGSWVTVATRRGELPEVRRPRRARQWGEGE